MKCLAIPAVLLVLAVGSGLLWALAALPAQAQSPPPQCIFGTLERPLFGTSRCVDNVSLGSAVGDVATFLIVLIVAIGIVAVAIGGYFYMTAAGGADRVQLAKGIIIAALAGIILALAGYLILKALDPRTVELRSPCIPDLDLLDACGPGIPCPPDGRCP